MDKISRFERILNLVERARGLDLMTANVIGHIQQQQVSLFKEITSEYTGKTKETRETREDKKDKIQKEEKSANLEKRENRENRELYTENNQRKKETDMADTMSPNELMEVLMRAAEQIKMIKENPPENPTPPADGTPATPSKDMETLGKLKQMSATVAEHLKIQVDIHKYAAAAIHESHKLSFDLYKEIDGYMKSQS